LILIATITTKLQKTAKTVCTSVFFRIFATVKSYTMLTILQVVVGIVFVLLLLSLLGTTIMELVSGWFALRGNHLYKSLHNMLGDEFPDFVSHPFYKQMIEDAQKDRRMTRRALPSYISPASFRSIFMDILRKRSGEQTHIAHHIENVKDAELKDLLKFLMRDAKGDQQVFEYKVDQWFTQVMDRVSGWYKRTTRYWLLGIGFTIALLFNADTIQIYKALSADAQLRGSINTSAQYFIAENPQSQQYNIARANPQTGTMSSTAPGVTVIPTTPVQSVPAGAVKVNATDLDGYTSSLGLGWGNINFADFSIYSLLEKLVGLLVTALAISLGAGFWFDALRRLVNINTTSVAPAASTAPKTGSTRKDDEEGDG
jgi:uncharacterized membrane protein YbaN (DUF454 family)